MAHDEQGKDVCVICGCKVFIEKELVDNTVLRCPECGRESKVEDLLKKWTSIPFLNLQTMTYYDGCHGWN